MKASRHLFVLNDLVKSSLVRNRLIKNHLIKSTLVKCLAGCLVGVSSALTASPALADQMYVSWYGPGFDGGYTANGEVFSRYDYTAAHPNWAFGTLVQLTNPETGAVVTVRINDRSGGALDISEQAARDLGTYYTGIAPVEVDILRWGE